MNAHHPPVPSATTPANPSAVTPAPPSAETLRAALAELLDGLPPRQAAQSVERLIASYRGTTQTHAPVLRDRADAVAYAAYRMPATFEAVRGALGALAAALPGWAPESHVDVGGGTGAATWAVGATWPVTRPAAGPTTRPTVDPTVDPSTGPATDAATHPATNAATDAATRPGGRSVTVLDWAEPALALGREIAAGQPALADVTWQRSRIGAALTIQSTDLVTISYVLGELTPEDRAHVVDAAAAAARTVVVVEPGTPDGYARVMAARDRLTGAGFQVAAPCPHSAACPIVPGTDWCHFSARVSRSSLHRQVKGGSLPYEDEKFSYVAATRLPATPAPARVVRRPQIRKGQVLLDLCEPDEALRRRTVTKRHGALYRAARDADWGDTWPGAGNYHETT